MKSIGYLLKAYGMAKESKCEHNMIKRMYILSMYRRVWFGTWSFSVVIDLFCTCMFLKQVKT